MDTSDILNLISILVAVFNVLAAANSENTKMLRGSAVVGWLLVIIHVVVRLVS